MTLGGSRLLALLWFPGFLIIETQVWRLLVLPVKPGNEQGPPSVRLLYRGDGVVLFLHDN